MTEDRDARVRDQYETYPYPARDPADEADRLIVGSPSHVLEIEHYLRGGRAAGDLNALVAGGGTGDGVIMLAQQLADRGQGRVTYVDISEASMAIARERARARALDNIRFVQGSLLELSAIAPGPYDYIDCCGVLHHLEDPAAGLAALRGELAGDGGLGLMLYGSLGRTGVYPMQSALRRLSGGDPPADRVALTRRLLTAIPDSNWLKRNPHLGDHLRGDDAGLYDLLLHPRDRSYTVGEIVALLAGAGLRLASFLPPAQYDPLIYLDDTELQARARTLPPLEQAALAEELSGAMKSHVFYAVPDDAITSPPDERIGPGTVAALKDIDPEQLAATVRRNGQITVTVGERPRRIAMPEGAADLLALIDGTRTLRQIHGRLRVSGRRLGWDQFAEAFGELLALLQPLNLLLLRDGCSPPRPAGKARP